jgi:excinuclease ABC subunit C
MDKRKGNKQASRATLPIGERHAAVLFKIKNAPVSPGCYLYKNEKGEVIYVGKAKNLNNRVKQYFQKNLMEWEKISRLVHAISDVEFVATDSELDALLLEHKLIKKHRPWYNSQLKDDVRHPLLRISLDSSPTFSISYERRCDRAFYFSCFFDESNVQDAIETFSSAWRTPICEKGGYGSGGRACLRYGMKKCSGPCEKLIEESEYIRSVKEITSFLEGGDAGILSTLRNEMMSFSERLEFEKAAAIQRILENLQILRRRAALRLYDLESIRRSALAARPYRSASFCLFYFLSGDLAYRQDVSEENADEGLRLFLNAIALAKAPLPESEWMKPALVDIFAEKCFCALSDESSPNDESLVKEAFCSFMRKRPV